MRCCGRGGGVLGLRLEYELTVALLLSATTVVLARRLGTQGADRCRNWGAHHGTELVHLRGSARVWPLRFRRGARFPHPMGCARFVPGRFDARGIRGRAGATANDVGAKRLAFSVHRTEAISSFGKIESSAIRGRGCGADTRTALGPDFPRPDATNAGRTPVGSGPRRSWVEIRPWAPAGRS